MTFKGSTVSTRVAVRDSSAKLANLAQRLTIGSGPVDSQLSTEVDALCLDVLSDLLLAGYEQPLPNDTAKVEDDETVTVRAGTTTADGEAVVAGSQLSHINLPTAAIVADGDIGKGILDRTGTVLLGTGVNARVVSNALTGVYFTGLLNAVITDGSPYNITTARAGSTITGRARVYVNNNQLLSLYLDSTAALQSGATVPVQNSAGLNIANGTVTVANNLVTAAKLPATTTAFTNGVSHTIVDAAGKSAQAVANVANGSLTNETLVATAALLLNAGTLSVKDAAGKAATATAAVAAGVPTATLPGTNAIVADAQTIAVTGGTVTLTVTNGVLTAAYTAS